MRERAPCDRDQRGREVKNLIFGALKNTPIFFVLNAAEAFHAG
jgi:hypothetical protein